MQAYDWTSDHEFQFHLNLVNLYGTMHNAVYLWLKHIDPGKACGGTFNSKPSFSYLVKTSNKRGKF